jgi:hypothetical protein
MAKAKSIGAKKAMSRKTTVKKAPTRARQKNSSRQKKFSGLVPAQRLVVFAAAFAIIGGAFLYFSSAAPVIKPLSVEALAGEGSGMVASKKYPGVYWWLRDGGESTAEKPREAVYAAKFDASGTPVAVRGSDKFPFFSVSGVENNNWEDIAVDDDGNIWVGDIGANTCSRTQKLLKLKEPDPSSNQTLSVAATYNFQFPDPANGCSTWNAEAMFWLDGKMYIFAKTSGSPIYRIDLPANSGGTATLTKLGKLAGSVSNISVSSLSDDRSRLMVASHGVMNVYKTSNTNLQGDALVKDIISRAPAFTANLGPGTKKTSSVEGGSFVRGTKNVVLIGEGKQLYFAKPAAYGDGSADTGGSTTKDTSAPSVSITSPANNTTVSGTITLEVSATDNVGITAADLFYDGSNVIRKGTSQGEYGWGSRFDTRTINDGAHTFGVTAYDAAGNQKTAQVTLNVSNGNTADTTAPAVSIISPAPNATVSGTITIEVSATDNVGLSSVNLYYDDTNVIREGTAQGNFGWGSRLDTEKLGNGTHTLSVKATDAAGNVKTAKVTVVVKN